MVESRPLEVGMSGEGYQEGLCFGVRSYTRRDLIILRSPLVQIPRPCNPDLAQDLFSSFSCFAERHSKRFVFINRVTSPVCLK